MGLPLNYFPRYHPLNHDPLVYHRVILYVYDQGAQDGGHMAYMPGSPPVFETNWYDIVAYGDCIAT